MQQVSPTLWQITVTPDDLADPLGRDGEQYRGASYNNGTGELAYAYTRGQGYLGAEAMADDPSGGGFWATVRGATLVPGGTTQADTVERWRWFPADEDGPPPGYTASLTEWRPRVDEEEFRAGFMLADLWNEDIPAVIGSTHNAVLAAGGGWVEIAPPWDYSQVLPSPHLAPDKSRVPAYTNEELTEHLRHIKADGLSVLLSPQVCCTETGALEGRDAAWLDAWFGEYERFLTTHAEIAEATGVDAFLIGYSLPKALSPETEKAYDYAPRFRSVIASVREIYSGPIGISALSGQPFGQLDDPWPWYILGEFASYFDFVGLAVWQSFAESDDAPASQVREAVQVFFSQVVDPFHGGHGLPIVIHSAAYGSFDGGARNEPDVFTIANAVYFPESEVKAEIDLLEQALVFDSLLEAVASRPYITGFFPFLYQYNALPLAPDYSVRGKPAEQVVAAWYRLAAGE